MYINKAYKLPKGTCVYTYVMKIHVYSTLHTCITHVVKVAAEEEKKGRKPRPNKLHPYSKNRKMNRTLWCPGLRTGTLGKGSNQLSPHTHMSLL